MVMQFRLKAASGPNTGKNYPLQNDTSIGSANDADLQLAHLLERHARIVVDAEAPRLEPAGAVEVNADPSARRPLRSGDGLRLGEHRFVLQAPGLRPPSVLQDVRPAPARTWLRWAIGLVAVGAAGAAGYYWLWPLLGN